MWIDGCWKWHSSLTMKQINFSQTTQNDLPNHIWIFKTRQSLEQLTGKDYTNVSTVVFYKLISLHSLILWSSFKSSGFWSCTPFLIQTTYCILDSAVVSIQVAWDSIYLNRSLVTCGCKTTQQHQRPKAITSQQGCCSWQHELGPSHAK